MNRRDFTALAAGLVASSQTVESTAADRQEPTLLHVAWLRFKPEVSAVRIQEHLAACRALPEKIPVLRSLVCGPNVSNRANGMTHGIIVEMRDLKALDEYLAHPEHVKVVTLLREDIAELLVMDLQL